MSEPKRIAWMAVGCSMFKEMCGDRVLSFLKLKDLVDFKFNDGALDAFSDWMEETYKVIHKALLLPANSKVVGVSLSYRFQYCQVAIQIECDDFRETKEGNAMPQVEALYYRTEDLLHKSVTHFNYWWNDAALVSSYKPVNNMTPLDRCSEELGHFAAPGSGLCYCGWVARDPETLKCALRDGIVVPESWWDSAYSSTSNNPTAEDAHHIINAVADQIPELAMTPAELRVPCKALTPYNGEIMATWQPDPDDVKMYQKNAAELEDRCEAKFGLSGDRCTLKKSHEGHHITASAFKFWTEELTAKIPEVKSSNRGYEFL